MASLVSEATCPPTLVPATVSSYLFPPSDVPVNVHQCNRCPNSSPSFGNTLVETVSSVRFTLVSAFELIVHTMLLGFGCPDCHIFGNDSFGPFVRHHTPTASAFSPTQTTAIQGTGSLVGEYLEYGKQRTPSASQCFMVRKVLPACHCGGVSSASATRTCRAVINPLSRHRTSSLSPLRDLPSSERVLYHGMKLDAYSDLTFSPPAVHSVRQLVGGKGARAFVLDTSLVEGVDSSSPDVRLGLEGGGNTEQDGLGDSRHASPVAETVVMVRSMDYGSMPVLPSTIVRTGSNLVSPKTTAMMELDSMNVVEQDAQMVTQEVGDDRESTTDLPMGLNGGHNLEESGLGYSRHATPSTDNSIPHEQLIIDKKGWYLRLSEAGWDVQYLGSIIVEMGTVICHLERRVDALEDDLDTYRRQKIPVAPISVLTPTHWALATLTHARPAVLLTTLKRSKGKEVATHLVKPSAPVPAPVAHPSHIPPHPRHWLSRLHGPRLPLLGRRVVSSRW